MYRRNTLFIFLLLAVPVVDASIFSRLIGSDKAAEQAGVIPSEDRLAIQDGVLVALMENQTQIPLVGYGVGNLEHDLIIPMVREALQDDKKTYLIDTAHVSQNEDLVAKGILQGAENANHPLQVHVVTKVWYTHLGHERTKLSLEDSLRAFQPVIDSDKVDLHLHVLLHWPRCYDTIHWMDCQGDEESLADHVRQAGPDPSKNPQGAWKESWKVLEDYYLSHKVASIGVSNFAVHDLEEMEDFARVMPMTVQMSLWSLLYDSHLVHYCHEHNMHVQVFNALHQTVLRPERAPRAFHHLQQIAVELSTPDNEVTPAQVVLAWLMQHGVSVLPRTGRMERLVENSAVSLLSIPAMSDQQVETVAHAVEAYLSGKDVKKDTTVSLTVHASTKDVVVYWMGGAGATRVAIVRKGESFNETTFPGHAYRFYDAQNMDNFVDHKITDNAGLHETVHVDLEEHSTRSEARRVMAGMNSEKSGVFGWLGNMLQVDK